MASTDDMRQELESHLADAVDELVKTGASRIDAQARAQTQFGNIQTTAADIQQTMAHRPWWNASTAAITGILVGVFISLGYWLRQYPLSGTLLQPVALSILYLGIYALVMATVKWMGEYWGLTSRRALWLALLFALLVNVSITIVYDIDKIFVPLHAVMVTLVVALPVAWRWPSLSPGWKRGIVSGLAVVTTWSALHGQAMLEFLQATPCVFVTHDNVPLTGELASCQHIPASDLLLWPLYLIILIGVVGLAMFLRRYWRNPGSLLHRKIVLSLAVAALPIIPSTIHDLNNYGRIDVISWKPAIYQAYQDVLGRNPQPKDIEFYGYTHAYQDMHRVKEVLYASYERRLKIDLLHQEVLHRTASEAEINFFVVGRQSVTGIRTMIKER